MHAIAMGTRLLYFSTGARRNGSQRWVRLRGKSGNSLGFKKLDGAGFEQEDGRVRGKKALRAVLDALPRVRGESVKEWLPGDRKDRTTTAARARCGLFLRKTQDRLFDCAAAQLRLGRTTG